MDLRLKDELMAPNYAGMSDADVATALCAETIDAPVPVKTADVRRYLRAYGLLAAIEDAAEFETDATKRRDARQFIGALADFSAFDLTNALYRQAVERDMAKVLPAEHVAAILAMATKKISRAAQLGIATPISADDVAAARAGV